VDGVESSATLDRRVEAALHHDLRIAIGGPAATVVLA